MDENVLCDRLSVDQKINTLCHLIGNTPMVEIRYTFRGRRRTIYAKCEYFNLTGSIKDRMALYIIEEAYRTGAIKPGDIIVEATSGNTGISLASIGRHLGHPVKIIMPDWLSEERKGIIRSLGAQIIEVSQNDGGFIRSIEMAREIHLQEKQIFLSDQFSNTGNVKAHERNTGREIWRQLMNYEKRPDAFVAGVGTGGTVMGVGRYLKSMESRICIHPIEPAESPTLSTGYKNGKHRIQGISDDFIPSIVQLKELDHIIKVSDGDAIIMAQKLASGLGLAVGISSGANFIGAVCLQNEIGDDKNVVTVFCDSNKKYLTTDLVRKEPVKSSYLAPQIELLEYRPIPRLSSVQR
ncbi:MAG TPA: cysteine synthase family protein [Ohtaekwangia sp.]